MKRYDHIYQQKWLECKEKVFREGLEGVSKENNEILLKFLKDMELGVNTGKGSRKGGRSPRRLTDLKGRLIFLAKKFEEKFKISDITKINEEQLYTFIGDMKSGVIKTHRNKNFRGSSTFARDFKAFWNWWVKINRKKGIAIPNIAEDLSSHPEEKPDWVYLTEEQIRQLCESVDFKYKVLIMFIYDTGIRAPDELNNVRVSDISHDFKELNIRQEVAKKLSFGRRIKLMLCSDLIKEYIKIKNLKPDDYLFSIISASANKYLQRYSKNIFGTGMSKGGKPFHKLTLYHFRHCASCYWLPRYKSESALKYRFGWKNSDKIQYYSEFIGMRDTITDEDLLLNSDKTLLEKRLSKTESENEILREKLMVFEEKFKMVDQLIPLLKDKSDLANDRISLYTDSLKNKKAMVN